MAKTKFDVFEKMQGFFTNPKKAFDDVAKADLSAALIYGAVGLLVMALLNSTVGLFIGFGRLGELLGGIGGGVLWLVMFVVTLVFGFVQLLVSGLWLHLWAYVFGARAGLHQTLKAVFYGTTPQYYLGWIPLIGIAAGIWALVLEGIGLMQLQKLSMGKAAAALIIAIAIPVAIFVFLMIAVMSNLPAGEVAGLDLPSFDLPINE